MRGLRATTAPAPLPGRAGVSSAPMHLRMVLTAVGALALATGCEIRSSGSERGAQAPGYAQKPYGQQPPGPQPYGQAPQGGQPVLGGVPQVAPGIVERDPISDLDLGWLRSRAAVLMQELGSALPEARLRRVAGIPLAVDDTPGEVNAFAGCVRGGAVMVVTDGLLDVTSFLARARANDDVFGTRKTDEYCAYVASHQTPEHAIANPPLGFFERAQEYDARRVARQHDVLDELLGFVLGHELAHHYLGHLPCTGAPGPFGMGEVARGISSAVPILNQPNELAADTAGTGNLLVMGARRSGYHLTEGGALLLMQFFSALDQLSPVDILFSFERTHPPPGLRIPVIQQTAAFYRTTGAPPPVFGF